MTRQHSAPMRIAFYAPLKPPDHATASGDRRVARLLHDALRLAGHLPFVASRLRSFDPTGARQARIAARAGRTADRLNAGWRARPDTAPAHTFTYHLYYKAPDWLGPAVSAALGIPYVVAEASFAKKRAGGPWDIGHRAVEAALRRADRVIGLNPADRDGVVPLLAHPDRFIAIAPFIDATPYAACRQSASPPRLVTVAMMRPGDKLSSYRVLGEALSCLLALDWSIEVIGDGPAHAAVAAALAPLDRVRYAGALGEAAVAMHLRRDRFVRLARDQRGLRHGAARSASERPSCRRWAQRRGWRHRRRRGHWIADAAWRRRRLRGGGSPVRRRPGAPHRGRPPRRACGRARAWFAARGGAA